MASNKGPAKLEAEIAELGDLPRGDLAERWTGLHGNAPPQRLTQDLLVRDIAYELQAQELGGLNAVEKKSLAAFAAGRASLGPKTLPNKAATSNGGMYTPPMANSWGIGAVTDPITPSCKPFFAPAGPVDFAGACGIVDQDFRHAAERAEQSVKVFGVLIVELPLGRRR